MRLWTSGPTYLLFFLHERADLPGLVHQAGLSAGIPANNIRIIASTNQERAQESAVLETVAFLPLQDRSGREHALWLKNMNN